MNLMKHTGTEKIRYQFTEDTNRIINALILTVFIAFVLKKLNSYDLNFLRNESLHCSVWKGLNRADLD